jgi:cysteinyl-tRNA synthetase
LQVESEKMSKSLGNFVTIRELLKTDVFGDRSWSGATLRLAMLRTHYRQPIDWTIRALVEADRTLTKWRAKFSGGSHGYGLELADGSGYGDPFGAGDGSGYGGGDASVQALRDALSDDLNTPLALAILHQLDDPREFGQAADLLGLDLRSFSVWQDAETSNVDAEHINSLVAARNAARKAKDFKESDRIRDELAKMGVVLKDTKDGTTWEIAR